MPLGHATWRQQPEAYNALHGIVETDDDDDDDDENCDLAGGPRTPLWQKMHERYCRFCAKNTEHDDDDDEKTLAELFENMTRTFKTIVDDDDEKPLAQLRQLIDEVMEDDASLKPQKTTRWKTRSLKSFWDDNDDDDMLVSACCSVPQG